jgi:hypothetical protein
VLDLTKLSDFVFDLICSESLMIEDLTHFAAVEPEVSVAEVDEADDSEEKQQVRVVKLALVFERIIAEFVAVWFVMHVWLVLPVVATGVAAEDVDVAIES